MRREESRSRREPPQSRRRTSEEEEEDEYPGELYDMYRNSRGNRSNNSKSRMQPRYIEEEDEYASDYDDGSFDENDFEMVSNRPQAPRARAQSQGRAPSRKPDIRKIRVKVHAEDTRYIMIGTAVEFPDLVDKVREKFGLRKRFKIRVRDDDMPNGDMITMGDQDDLDMAIMSVKANAKRERLDMGKMEVSLVIFHIYISHLLTSTLDLDSRSLEPAPIMDVSLQTQYHLSIFSSHLTTFAFQRATDGIDLGLGIFFFKLT